MVSQFVLHVSELKKICREMEESKLPLTPIVIFVGRNRVKLKLFTMTCHHSAAFAVRHEWDVLFPCYPSKPQDSKVVLDPLHIISKQPDLEGLGSQVVDQFVGLVTKQFALEKV